MAATENKLQDIHQKLGKVKEEDEGLAEESRKLKEEAKLKSKAQKNQEVRHTPDFILLKYSCFLVDTFANDPYAWLVFDLIWFCFVLGFFCRWCMFVLQTN